MERSMKYESDNTTLDFYNKNAFKYSEETALLKFDDRQNMLLKYISPGAHILDLGCGAGRDSKSFINKGYKVTAIDGSEELCKIASNNIGQKVICKRFEDLDMVEEFDAIWACASIIHAHSNALPHIISNISRALKPGGFFYVTFKYGDFKGEINGRYFTYLTESTFSNLLKPFTELQIVETDITHDVRSNKENEKWLNVIIRKEDKSC